MEEKKDTDIINLQQLACKACKDILVACHNGNLSSEKALEWIEDRCDEVLHRT